METSTHYADPQELVAFLIALAFVMYCCGCFLYGALSQNVKPLFQKFNEDNVDLLRGFDVGCADEPPPLIVQEVKQNKPDDGLFQDCIAVLASFGLKKRESIAVATDLFQRHPEVETVEQFIKEYFKNEH
jgi:hypothetical protein